MWENSHHSCNSEKIQIIKLCIKIEFKTTEVHSYYKKKKQKETNKRTNARKGRVQPNHFVKCYTIKYLE